MVRLNKNLRTKIVRRALIKPLINETSINQSIDIVDEKKEDNIKEKEVLSSPKVTKKNNKKNIQDMTTQEKINQVNSILDTASVLEANNIKKIAKDRGLIERTESSKIVLTEDNKELLND